MICYPKSSGDLTAEEYSDFYNSASTSSALEFAFDARAVIEASKDTCLIMYELDDTDKWKEFSNADEFIAYYTQQLKEAGIDKIIDECNRNTENMSGATYNPIIPSEISARTPTCT